MTKKIKKIASKDEVTFKVSVKDNKKKVTNLICNCYDLEILLSNLDKKFKIIDIEKIDVSVKVNSNEALKKYIKKNPNLEFGNTKEN